jgi:hypothetical protein
MDKDLKTGRFQVGNKAAAGNPLARPVQLLRVALVEAVTPEKMKEVAEALLKEACSGNVAAAKLLFERTLGKPLDPPDIVDRLRELEDRFDGSNNPAA